MSSSNKKTSSNSTKRSVALYASSQSKVEKALQVMEHRISQDLISFREVAKDTREAFVHDYLPLYFEQIEPSATELRIAALEAISFHEGKISFLKRFVQEDLGSPEPSYPSTAGSASSSAANLAEDENSDQPKENRFDLNLFDIPTEE